MPLGVYVIVIYYFQLFFQFCLLKFSIQFPSTLQYFFTKVDSVEKIYIEELIIIPSSLTHFCNNYELHVHNICYKKKIAVWRIFKKYFRNQRENPSFTNFCEEKIFVNNIVNIWIFRRYSFKNKTRWTVAAECYKCQVFIPSVGSNCTSRVIL